MFEYTKQDFQKGLNGIDLLHPDDRDKAVLRLSDYNAGKYLPPTEYQILKKDGTGVPVLFKAIPVYKEDEIIGFRASITDISRLKQTEAELRESEAKLKLVMDGVSVSIVFVDSDLRYNFVNKAYTDWYNQSKEDIEGKYIRDLLSEDVFERALPHYQAALSGKPVHFENRTIREGEEKYVSVSLAPHYREDKVVGFFSTIMDITERRQAEAELKKNEKKYKTLIENSPYGIFIVDKNKRYIEVNESACTMTGYSKNELLSLSISDIQSLKNPDLSVFPEIINSGKVNRTIFLRHKDGHDFPVTIKGYKVDDNLVGICEDITEKVKNEQLIISSLKEKETLLHEIHHRVKNNMAVIGSLLKMQSNSIEDEQIKEVLKESQSRINAMSAVHETLHGSKNLSEIDLKTYLSKITTSIFQTYSVTNRVKLTTDINGIPIRIDQANPIGLVINELISNSLKYAFPDESKGEITVSMKKLDKELELIVMDDGVGISDGFDWKNSSSLGLKIVRTLVENQLDGSIDMESKNGTKFTIKFNIET